MLIRCFGFRFFLLLAAWWASTTAAHARRESDIVPPPARKAVLALAEHLARPPQPAPLPAELMNPFNPEAFAPKTAAPVQRSVPLAPPPPSAHDMAETLAHRLPRAGVMNFRGEPMLTLGHRHISVGDILTVSHGGGDHELELVAIGDTSFTVRYQGAEFTRALVAPQ